MTPASRFAKEKAATASIKIEMSNGIALDGTTKTRSAPKTEPTDVRETSKDKRRRSNAPLLKKGNVPPRLQNVKPNIFVARATRGSMPNAKHRGHGDERIAACDNADDACKKENND